MTNISRNGAALINATETRIARLDFVTDSGKAVSVVGRFKCSGKHGLAAARQAFASGMARDAVPVRAFLVNGVPVNGRDSSGRFKSGSRQVWLSLRTGKLTHVKSNGESRLKT